MYKHAIACRNQTQQPVIVFIYTSYDSTIQRYVGLASTATGENGIFLADSAANAIDDICRTIRNGGNQIVQGPVLLARSRVKVIRWDGNTFMVSFRDGALIPDELLNRMASTRNPAALPQLLFSEEGVPAGRVHRAFGRDETLVWDAEVLANVRAAHAAKEREQEEDRVRELRNEPAQLGDEWNVEDRDFWIPEPRVTSR